MNLLRKFCSGSNCVREITAHALFQLLRDVEQRILRTDSLSSVGGNWSDHHRVKMLVSCAAWSAGSHGRRGKRKSKKKKSQCWLPVATSLARCLR